MAGSSIHFRSARRGLRLCPWMMAADGSMAGQMQYGTGEEIPALSRDRIDWVRLSGRISGTTMDATITTLRCVRRLTAQRSGD